VLLFFEIISFLKVTYFTNR